MSTQQLEVHPGILLTIRQGQVLFYLALGKTLEEIGMILGLARTTVKAHAEMLYAKFHVENRSQLITQAFLKGFLRGTTAVIMAICCYSAAVQTTGDDQLRNFRTARRAGSSRAGRRQNIHPSIVDFDHA